MQTTFYRYKCRDCSCTINLLVPTASPICPKCDGAMEPLSEERTCTGLHKLLILPDRLILVIFNTRINRAWELRGPDGWQELPGADINELYSHAVKITRKVI